MLVVLGAVVLFSLLGYAALMLSGKDAILSGSLVDIKSQRLAANAGLNLGVTRLQRSAANTVSLLTAFVADPGKQWIDLGGAVPALVASEPDWLRLSSVDSSACKLRIVGVTNANLTTSTIDVALESIGRGRNGDSYRMRAVYRVHGINFQASVSSNGPMNAFMALGGIEQMHVGNKIDGPIYSGNPNAETVIENANTNVVRLRLAGSLRITSSLSVHANSIVNGYLDINAGGSTVTFDSNLVVKGGLKRMDGKLTVGRSLYVYRGPFSMGSAGSSVLTVGKWLYVRDTVVYMSSYSKATVGTSGDGFAYLAEGMDLRSDATATVNGPMHLGRVPSDYNSLTIWSWPSSYSYAGYNRIEGSLVVNGPFDQYGDTAHSSLFYVSGTTTLNGAASFAGMPCLAYGGSRLNVAGKAILRNGINPLGSGTVSLSDSSWMFSNAGQKNTSTSVVLGGPLSMNGYLDHGFKTNTGKWRFASSSNWSYNDDGLSPAEYPDASSINNAASVPTRRSANTATPGWVADTTSFSVPSLVTGLGYSASDTDMSVAANPVSRFDWNHLGQTVKDSSDWRAVRTRYVTGRMKGACDDVPGANSAGGFEAFGNFNRYPSAEVLACIYGHEKDLGGSSPLMWNGFLVLHLTENYDGNRWQNQGPYSGGTLPSGVKILYVIDQSGMCNSWGTGNPGWFAGLLGSTQVLVSSTDMTGFFWEGTLYGYLLFNYTAGKQMFSGQHLMTLVGAWENKGQVWFTKQPNEAGSLAIEYSSTTAKGIFQDIAASFSGGASAVLKFNSDGAGGTTTSNTPVVQDGWVQFERLGEFR